jgi:hypothetical protein
MFTNACMGHVGTGGLPWEHWRPLPGILMKNGGKIPAEPSWLHGNLASVSLKMFFLTLVKYFPHGL